MKSYTQPNSLNLKLLIDRIAKMIDHKIETTSDFDYLSETIFRRIGVYISASTLKRLWGYSSERVTPRLSTLSFLAKFVGYKDWKDFCQNNEKTVENTSAHILNRSLDVDKVLSIGDRVLLSWLPDRICEIEYLGNHSFRIVNSQNTKLKAESTFMCSTIIENEPLYIDNLVQDSKHHSAFVCGMQGGVRFEILNQKQI